MKIDLTGKKAIVCGGSRGIGKAIALGFAAAGGDVSICARDPKALEETKGRDRQARPQGPCRQRRSRQGRRRARLCARRRRRLGGVDFLVNNASAFGSSDDDKGWGANLAVDMMAIVHATQEAYPALKQVQGSVVNISSIAAFHPAARQPPYGAIKAAVVHYTVTQAALYAKDRVRVNCIAPGSIEFPGGVWDRRKTSDPKLYNATLASIPFGRMGYAEEVANVALFLASPLASWVTGQIHLRGGRAGVVAARRYRGSIATFASVAKVGERSMRTLGNILWHFPFFGFLTAAFYWLLGLLLTILILPAPIGLGLMEFGKFLLAPFGQAMVSKTELKVEQNPAWQAYSTIIMILYIPFGLVFVVLNAIQVFLFCLSIIGIPVALVIAKSLGTVLNPVNKICVSSAVADELVRRKASAEVAKYVGQ